MLSIRNNYNDNDSDEEAHKPPARAPGISGQLSLSTHMASTTLADGHAPPLTDSQLDAALLDYESEPDDAKMKEPCKKHPDCIHAGGDKHPGRCIWFDEDTKRRCQIPDDAPGWVVAKSKAKQSEQKEVNAERSTRASKNQVQPQPQPQSKKDGKKRKEPDFAACIAEVNKATRAAEVAEAAAKKAKIEAETKLVAAAKREKERLRRDASVKRREAERIRLLAEKRAREEEAEALEMERQADVMSQTYY